MCAAIWGNFKQKKDQEKTDFSPASTTFQANKARLYEVEHTEFWNTLKILYVFLYESIYAMVIEKFHHLVDSYRNTISEWTVDFRYGNFTLKLARGKKSLASRGILGGWRNFHTWNSALWKSFLALFDLPTYLVLQDLYEVRFGYLGPPYLP